ncbi:MAG TPA: hypothetical protein VGP63_29285 [Planctomycetaceae bacterium]|jgi:hypothetical protein|nr:hypothetical protein [Planctomycetaceae bacterium]
MYRNALPFLMLLAVPRVTHADEFFHGHHFGKSYNVAVTCEVLKKAPVWDESRAENPPISARKALKVATDFRKTLIPDSPKWRWELKFLALHKTDGRWYWLADFLVVPQPGGIDGESPDFFVAVLMDGTVVKPDVDNDP